MKIEYKLNQDNFIKIIKNKTRIEDNVIDLSEIKFADIFGILSLILMLREEYQKENKMTIYIPNNINVANYLHICGFIDYIKNYAEIKYNPFNLLSKLCNTNNNYTNKDYIPIQKIKCTNDVDNILGKVRLWLEKRGVERREISRIITLLLELIGNALDHSESEEGCLFAMQKYKNTLMISVADFGVGINESISRNTKFKDQFNNNEEIIQYIFTEKNYISGEEDDEGRGNGFFYLNKFTLERKIPFTICTRECCYTSSFGRINNTRTSEKIYDLQGTHINFNINL